jgi:hypothetical protein
MSPGACRPRRVMLIVIAALALLVAGVSAPGPAGAAPAPAATTLTYGPPTTITGTESTLYSVSCASATFCMAGDDNGQLLEFDGTSWTLSYQLNDPDAYIVSVSCVSTRFCMAVGGDHLMTYDGHSWTLSPRYTGYFFGTQGDCASSTLCFVVSQGADGGGRIHGWNGHKWVLLKTRLSINVVATSCASISSCFALTTNGYLFRYNGRAWTRSAHRVTGTDEWESLSCPTTALCVAIASHGLTAQRTGGTWSRTTLIPGADSPEVGALRGGCASADFCGAADFRRGRTATYQNGAWSFDANPLQPPIPLSGERGLLATSCGAVNSCVTVGEDGEYWVRTASGWGPKQLIPATVDRIVTLACTSATSCIAFDRRATSGEYNGSTWTAFSHQSALGGSFPSSVSCPIGSDDYCMLVTNPGRFVQLTNGKTSDAKKIHSSASAPAVPAAAVSCTSADLCLAVTHSAAHLAQGSVTVWSGKAWTAPARPDGREIDSVSCVSAVVFCAAGTNGGAVILYSGHGWAAPTSLPGAGAIDSVSCPSATSCMAVSGSRTYAYNGTTWTPYSVPGAPHLLHVSCASADACGAVGFHTASYFDGTAWSAAGRIDDTGDDNVGIACPAAQDCIVGTSHGEAIVGS